MAAYELPEQSILIQLLRYESETGKLFWRERPDELFKASGAYSQARIAAAWNSKNAGKEALITIDAHGYPFGSVFKKLVRAHRVIWKLVHGTEPEQIDHINGDRADNRIINLRAVSNADNHRNMSLSTANKSGVTGVFWFARTGRWRSEITIAGKNVHLGYYLNKNDAIAARHRAEVENGFHPNHGRKRAG